MQQCVYHMKFGNVCEVDATGTAWIGLEQNFIDTAVNNWKKHLLVCVRIVSHHFEQFYCNSWKWKTLWIVSQSVRNVNNMCFYALC